MKYDIIVFGGAVIDAFLELDVNESKGQICLPVDSKLLVKNLWFSTGGGGTNTAVAFSKLGLKTGFIGKLGKDENADLILEELKKYKIDFLGKQGKEPTGFSVILDGKQKNRTILTSKEANEHISWKDIYLNKINSMWIYFSSMSGETLETQIKLAEWASQKGIKIAYNPSYYLCQKGAAYLKKLLRNIYVLILNEEEAKSLVGKKDLFKKIHCLGPKIVCVTRGEKGSVVSDGNYLYKAKAHKIKVREKTGAGDAFASGFVFGLMKFQNIERAIQIGTLNAESVIQKAGAKNGLLSWSEMKREMEKKKVRVEEKNI
ncbi:carbohydrate kinase family protein [Candidatus Pacearchaeota archaeon]|nr:carbohydrate kinase family protein [Candidatus Pacearchaeota archaeon]